MLSKVSLKVKLIMAIIFAVIVPVVIISSISISDAKKAIINEASMKLEALTKIKKDRITSFIKEIEKGLKSYSSSYEVVNLFSKLRKYHYDTGVKADGNYDVTSERYKKLWENEGSFLTKYRKEYGYYDIFLICSAHGHVMYTAAKESDLGENLVHGRYKDSGLAKVWKKVVSTDNLAFEDFSSYPPSNGEQAAFVGYPVKENGKTLGVLAFQIPSDLINNIMNERTGMGDTGETYLSTKTPENKYEFRSKLITMGNDKYKTGTEVEPTEYWKECLDNGKIIKNPVNKIFEDSNGTETLISYANFNFGSTLWGIFSKLDMAEVNIPVSKIISGLIWQIIVITLIFALGAFFFGIYINKGITLVVGRISNIVENIKQGNLQERTSQDGVLIDFKTITSGVNDLIEAFVKPINTTSKYVEKISIGELPEKINEEYHGDFNHIKNNLNNLIDVNHEISTVSKKIAEGDLTVNLRKRSQNDTLLESLIQMTDNLKSLISSIKENINSMAAGSEELTAVSFQLSTGANTATEQVNSVAGATEQLTANISAIATAAEEINVNVSNVSDNSEKMTNDTNSIAETIEELTQSLKSVSLGAEKATKIAGEASIKSNNATIVMNELGSAAKEIGKVTEVIKKIAEQTNLLALNATIEAASAGEAGRGFAVVAKEIKELARQSAKAADNISDEIENIQSKTSGAVKTITDVSKTINEVNENIKKIDKNVEEQTANSGEISRKVNYNANGIKSISRAINEISSGIADVSKNIGEGAIGTETIASDIGKVTTIAKDSQNGAEQIQKSAEELAKMAAELNSLMNKFKL